MTNTEKIKNCFDNLKGLNIICAADIHTFDDLKNDTDFICDKPSCKHVWREKLNAASCYGCPYCGPASRSMKWSDERIKELIQTNNSLNEKNDSSNEIIKKLKHQIEESNAQNEQDKQDWYII